ncbi:tetratricopeptide repeat protein [Flavobacterium sp.]|uniref:tetratricopeptide repeat protein n=1 Tax=Flavobacterium sp. TaxID=239 RepID=UPI0028BD328D|nr:tetratricopeptide repeat protein [Flavobacterium sp.]
MKQIIFLFLSAISFIGYSQSDLKFDKRFVQCENKWVAFKPDSTNVYNFGFIYIDAQAGLTLDYAGTFTIDDKGKFITKKIEQTGSMKYRLQPNNVLVAIIPETKFTDLEILTVPDWLKHYKGDENSIERLYRWGYLYNGWNECSKALEYLTKAEKIDPNYKGLSVELAFSYNCLQQYDDAIKVLQKALKANDKDAYTVKEYIYALTKKEKFEEAKEYYRKSLKTVPDKTYQAEIAYNILQGYFLKKDVKKFDEWLKESETIITSNPQFKNFVEQMKTEIKK